MGLHSEGQNQDWTRPVLELPSPFHPSCKDSQSANALKLSHKSGATTDEHEERLGSRSAATINQELIQSCEMPRLINLCQYFSVLSGSVPCAFPYPYSLPSLAQRSTPPHQQKRKKEMEHQSRFQKAKEDQHHFLPNLERCEKETGPHSEPRL